MGRVRRMLRKLLHPPLWVMISVPPVSFAALIVVFALQSTKNTLTYSVYCMSAYSLAIWTAAVPGLTKRAKSAMMSSRIVRRAIASKAVVRYRGDLAFRGSVGMYQGMALNFAYAAFRAVAGIRYASVWFLSMAVYYLALGGLRTYLIACYRRRSPVRERRCYRAAARFLFLLNIPMGGMIVLMVRTNFGFSYPGHVIYLSALYTFYAAAAAVVNLARFRRLGSPILSAARALNLVSAMMSVLGLQTAMIARFSENGENYRRMMNAVTGGFVYGAVIVLALCMLLHDRKLRREAQAVE